MSYPFVKGHGTENDFVLLPDPDGSVHGGLDAARVRALCDRHAGIGGDGVLRVIRSASYPGAGIDSAAEWFMDYRNADGSLAEMCGNGTRVFADYLRQQGLAGDSVTIATRAGDKTLTYDGTDWTVDLGAPRLLGWSEVSIGAESWKARHVDMGNPHAVVLLDDGVDQLDLTRPPVYDATVYPHGVNVEFAERVRERHLRMRVHERGVGETRSCGTGIGAVAVAALDAEGDGRTPPYTIDVPGGRLRVARDVAGHVFLTGPAVLVGSGTTNL